MIAVGNDPSIYATPGSDQGHRVLAVLHVKRRPWKPARSR